MHLEFCIIGEGEGADGAREEANLKTLDITWSTIPMKCISKYAHIAMYIHIYMDTHVYMYVHTAIYGGLMTYIYITDI